MGEEVSFMQNLNNEESKILIERYNSDKFEGIIILLEHKAGYTHTHIATKGFPAQNIIPEKFVPTLIESVLAWFRDIAGANKK